MHLIRRRRAPRRGLTLVELLTAVALGGVVVAAGVTLMQAGFTSSNNLMTSAASSAQRRMLSDFLSSRLPSVALPLREAYALDDSAGGGSIDKMVFKVVWNGRSEYWTLWVDCAGERPAIRTDFRERAYSSSYPPSFSSPPPAPAGGNPMTRVRDCEQGAFEYLGADGRPITDLADRLTQTRLLRIRIRPPKNAKSSDYTLNIPVGINSAPNDLTPLPNGDFELPFRNEMLGAIGSDMAGATFDSWTTDATTQLFVAKGDSDGASGAGVDVSPLQSARVLRDGGTSGGIMTEPFVSYGDPLTVRVRADHAGGGDAKASDCRVQVITTGADYTILREVPASDDVEWSESNGRQVSTWQTVSIRMAGDTGQERRIRLAATGDTACAFDQLQSNG